MRVAIVIPARYSSSRLPGKPLADIVGKPMIQHVFEKASMVSGVDEVWVATDDSRIIEAVSSFGGNALLTSPNHESGSDRLAEVSNSVDADVYVNIQGDEPLIRPEDVGALIREMKSDLSIDVGTLCHLISDEEANNPNTVKLVVTDSGDAMYFSRAKIPFSRDGDLSLNYLKHVGVYAYRKNVLKEFSSSNQSDLERIEKLEQLRLLSRGYKIRAVRVAPTGPGVDTPECLERVRALLQTNKAHI